MLAQLLPGFRDFRTPLVTGYLWLVVVWVAIGAPIPSVDDSTQVMVLVSAVREFLSPAALLVALSFLAYLIGMLLMVDFKLGRGIRIGYWHLVPALRHRDLSAVEHVMEAAIHRAHVRRADEFAIETEFGLDPLIEDNTDYQMKLAENQGSERMLAEEVRTHALDRLKSQIMEEVFYSIPSLATKLQENNADLFSSYDRDKSESEFRLSISLPIAALATYTSILEPASAWWPWLSIASIVAAVALVVKGLMKRFSAVNVVITALELGIIESQMLARLDAIGPKNQ